MERHARKVVVLTVKKSKNIYLPRIMNDARDNGRCYLSYRAVCAVRGKWCRVTFHKCIIRFIPRYCEFSISGNSTSHTCEIASYFHNRGKLRLVKKCWSLISIYRARVKTLLLHTSLSNITSQNVVCNAFLL